MKKKIVTISIVLATVILAGVAIFTAVRLYQLRQTSVSPPSPESEPEAANDKICKLSFNITLATTSPTATPTTSPKPTPVSRCDESCGVNGDCASGLICYGASIAQAGKCRKASCPKQ